MNSDKINPAFFEIINNNAISPYKRHPSDIGFDVYLIERKSSYGSTTMFGTGLKIKPPKGYYFQMMARSSLHKSGYILATSTSIIDPEYRGELFVPLTRVDPNAKELDLPFQAVQLILTKAIYYDFINTESLEDTTRGSGGFGSTTTKNTRLNTIDEPNPNQVISEEYIHTYTSLSNNCFDAVPDVFDSNTSSIRKLLSSSVVQQWTNK